MTELDKWGSVHDDFVTITEFLAFLSSKGVSLCSVVDEIEQFQPVVGYQNLLYEYFNIDKNKLEKERRKLLESIKQ